MSVKIIITAPRGKMGRLITQCAAAREDIEIVGALGPEGRDYIGKDLGDVAMVGRSLGVPVVSDLKEIIDKADVIIDFSTVEEGRRILKQAVAHGKALVCGTTGFTEEDRAAFAEAGKTIPCMLAANTSRLVNILYKLVREAAALAPNTDAEILEMHDAKKLDAPSGTAKELGAFIAEARSQKTEDVTRYGRQGRCPRNDGEIAFHSIRGGDISSSHTVYLVGTGERLELTHHSQSFMCFATGAVDCALYLADKPAGSYTVQDCFGL